MVINLRKLPVPDQRREVRVRQLQDMPRRLLEGRRFLVADVGLLALGESVDEEGAMRLPVQDQGPIAPGTPLSRACHALLDDPAAEIGIHQALLRSVNRIA
jgi:hypothetical protein